MSNKWVVVHAGQCDLYTELIGDYFAREAQGGKNRDYNYFGLRPCGGLVESACLYAQNGSLCDAIHISWIGTRALQELSSLQGTHINQNQNQKRHSPGPIYHDSPRPDPWIWETVQYSTHHYVFISVLSCYYLT